eukprot:TRINITY_DN4292_c0_g1_i1.p1 TRINITY_DN4292_c0_g1~~TRINITY_DN4292_c0_g1_i1.p1  ORF type:complete len:429 (+),score=111.57 TRINITY_DN4292_c0_g1_i1:64-1350(+)
MATSPAKTPMKTPRGGQTPRGVTLLIEMSGKGGTELPVAATWCRAGDVMAAAHHTLRLGYHVDAYEYTLVGFGSLVGRARMQLEDVGLKGYGSGEFDRVLVELMPKYVAREALKAEGVLADQYGPAFVAALKARNADRVRKCVASAELPKYTLADAFVEAAKAGDAEATRFLLGAAKAGVSAADRYGATALHCAARHGHEALSAMLIEAGAAVDARDKKEETPLHWAVHHEQVVQLLLDHASSLDPADGTRCTPLHWAARAGETAVVRRLVAAGADVEAMESYGLTPLHVAAREGHENCVRALVGCGASVEARDNNGWTPLHWAAREGQISTVRALVGAGCDMIARNDGFGPDSAGMTPLHLAVRRERPDVVDFLVGSLPAGAIEKKARSGHTALDEAVELGHNGIIKMIRNGRRTEATCGTQGCILS